MKKVVTFLCENSYSTKDAKADQGVHIFISDEHSVKQSKKKFVSK